MSEVIKALEPQAVWEHFANLNAVPRASKKEEQVIAFMVEYGKSLGLPTKVDDVGNVIITKPATAGKEDRPVAILQSHLDMVHQKNNDTVFDFDSEGIKMFVDGDWVKAEGTTLGADNGLGVAAIMGILASKDIPHGPLEALFTIDEETGMTGALGLKGGLLEGRILLNLDTEDDEELTIGCAGGIDVTATGSVPMEAAEASFRKCRLTLRGLQGGHSGMEIHLGLANANKLINRVLTQLEKSLQVRIHSIDGGGLRNAIPRESVAVILAKESDSSVLEQMVAQLEKELKIEHRKTDPNLELILEDEGAVAEVMTKDFQSKFLKAIYACPNGIYRMSPEIEGLVQTSNNLARVLVKDGQYQVLNLTRGSVDSEKLDQANTIAACFELIGGKVEFGGSYPGWSPNPDSKLTSTMVEVYRELYQAEPHVNACHAGLECGILSTNYPGMEMISFGPNIKGAHSPDERAQISSVKKFWQYLKEVLNRL